ncbi:nuclear transcription factor y subunit c-4 protein [Mucor ambiguus]|uniref:Nuclear transcription factor y subunit c-4 protein n=1 Tax=Mucor ambiguus TaxID=91626 RepID=A0A0C9M6T7_9FUNG|nr:nuclear transcription factor y subunit c-4 protein [Mucor ambiguus]
MSNQQPHEDQQRHHDIQAPAHLQQQQQQASAQPAYQQLNATTAPGGQPVFDLGKFWMEEMHNAEVFDSDFKNHPLPLARIKKVMKTDQDVKAPILFAKGCEIFITELTKRAWVHAEENKRRTLQRSDIATAISKTDMCDFLIDIVPREEAAKTSNPVYDQTVYAATNTNAAAAAAAAAYYQPPYNANQMDPQTYYPPLPQFTNDQVQQYQMQLQQFAQQQQQQQQPNYETEAKPKD